MGKTKRTSISGGGKGEKNESTMGKPKRSRKCRPAPSPAPPPPGALVVKQPTTTTTTTDDIVARNMNFGLQTAQRVLQDALTGGEKRGAVCSPLSVVVVVNILAVGAAGDLLRQLLGLLECDDVEEVNESAAQLMEVLMGSGCMDGPRIGFANAVWVAQQLHLKGPFRKVLEDVHKVYVRRADFVNKAGQVVKEANLWAGQQTKGMIKQILTRDSISIQTTMILVNALYFKGAWEHTFKRKDTKTEVFHLLNGTTVQTLFMTQLDQRFDYGTFENCKVLGIPYKQGKSEPKGIESDDDQNRKKRFTMYIFLPDEKHGLSNLIQNVKMDANMFKDDDRMKLTNNVKIRKVSIPKFSFESGEISLIEPMKKLGLTLPFSKNCKGFTQMFESTNSEGATASPYVSEISQKCRIDVDERGTEAAAVTRVQFRFLSYTRVCGGPPPIDFIADHPFVYMIREDFSGAILFLGIVLDPRSRVQA